MLYEHNRCRIEFPPILMKHILIAHQSTIPHYRVPFYNALELLKPDSWRFDVVFDPSELTSPQFFNEPLKREDFHFSVLETKTRLMKVFGKKVAYQTFWSKASQYDLVVVEHAVNNLTYPLCQLHQFKGVKLAYWGHGRDYSIETKRGLKLVAERLKLWLAHNADGFFAYTDGGRDYLVGQGLASEKIFVLNNTIDIQHQRDVYAKYSSERQAIRQRLGVADQRVLLFVGRFTPNKRLDLLLESFRTLRQSSDMYHLILVGDGYLPSNLNDQNGVSHLGAVVDLDELGPLYVASDLFVFPGSVGLGPLQALCYDLPILTIDSSTHMPEFEYLNSANSIVLSPRTSPQDYAHAIIDLFETREKLQRLQSSIWSTICHLTIEQMAYRFIQGVDTILVNK